MAVGDAVLSLALIGYGAYLMVGAGRIRVLPVYSRIGPRFFPYLVAGAALLCGVLLLIAALRGERAEPEGGEDVDLSAKDNLRPVIVIAAGLALGAVLMRPAGFVIAATLIFWTVALAFGGRNYVRIAVVGLALSLVSYLSFTRLLDLTLPAGILPL